MPDSGITTAVKLGVHEARLDNIERTLEEVKDRGNQTHAGVTRIELVLAQQAGERKVARYVGGIVSGIAASLATALGISWLKN